MVCLLQLVTHTHTHHKIQLKAFSDLLSVAILNRKTKIGHKLGTQFGKNVLVWFINQNRSTCHVQIIINHYYLEKIISFPHSIASFDLKSGAISGLMKPSTERANCVQHTHARTQGTQT